jgi:hypothetical protein
VDKPVEKYFGVIYLSWYFIVNDLKSTIDGQLERGYLLTIKKEKDETVRE